MYRLYRAGTPVGLARSAFTMWMEGKVLVADKSSVVAWFIDEEKAEEFVNHLNSKTAKPTL